MTLTFFTNYIHHHQIPLADAFYQQLGTDYRFVAMEELPDWLIKGGYDPTIDRPYIIRAYESSEAMSVAKRLMLESDIVIHAYGPRFELIERMCVYEKYVNDKWLNETLLEKIANLS